MAKKTTEKLYGLTEIDRRRLSDTLRWSEREINRKPIHRRRSGLMGGGGSTIDVFSVISNATGGGYYRCVLQSLNSTYWNTDTDVFYSADPPDISFVLNIVESGTSGHTLEVDDLIMSWEMTDDEGNTRYIGINIS